MNGVIAMKIEENQFGEDGDAQMRIMVSNQSKMPIYEQIIEQIKTALIQGELKVGEALPSIRGLAKELQISVITIKRAYEDLEKEGLIYSVTGKGFYVCEQNTDLLREKQVAAIEKRVQDLLEECQNAEISPEELIEMIEIFSQSGKE